MEVVIRKALLATMFGPVLAIFTLGSILFIWPFFSVMDWITEGRAEPQKTFMEVLDPWMEFVASVRAIK